MKEKFFESHSKDLGKKEEREEELIEKKIFTEEIKETLISHPFISRLKKSMEPAQKGRESGFIVGINPKGEKIFGDVVQYDPAFELQLMGIDIEDVGAELPLAESLTRKREKEEITYFIELHFHPGSKINPESLRIFPSKQDLSIIFLSGPMLTPSNIEKAKQLAKINPEKWGFMKNISEEDLEDIQRREREKTPPIGMVAGVGDKEKVYSVVYKQVSPVWPRFEEEIYDFLEEIHYKTLLCSEILAKLNQRFSEKIIFSRVEYDFNQRKIKIGSQEFDFPELSKLKTKK